ncbi:MAG: hypothetical protein Q8J85_00595 [Sulfuricurvum sp.]|nr:hypothetical protein [Sulfuricurvum sp.]MDP3022669.1 hypothetical protein [Sulfuricurvum sp.]
MEFVTSAILGGILYDFAKIGTGALSEYLKASIKGYLFTEEEIQVLSSIIDETKQMPNLSKEAFSENLSKNHQMIALLEKMNDKGETVQINTVTENYGAVMGNNYGTMNFGSKK